MPTSKSSYRFTHHPGGNVTVSRQNGDRFTLGKDGIHVDLSVVRAVGIKRLDEVESHTVNDFAGSRSHVVRFVNGALLQYAYNSAGQLIELSSLKLACSLSNNNELLFYLYQTRDTHA